MAWALAGLEMKYMNCLNKKKKLTILLTSTTHPMATEPQKYFLNIKLLLLLCCAAYQTSKAQSFFADSLLQPVPGTDSNYIARFKLSNEVRFVYGGSDFSMLWGSSKADNNTKAANFSSNSNDYMGLGLTYKFIDADVTLALRNSALFPFERKTLRQFKLAAGFMATNNMHLRFYVNRYKGLIAFTNEGAFRSDPQLRFFKTGAQLTYVFNKERFSYRAFYSQSELQRQSAGSPLDGEGGDGEGGDAFSASDDAQAVRALGLQGYRGLPQAEGARHDLGHHHPPRRLRGTPRRARCPGAPAERRPGCCSRRSCGRPWCMPSSCRGRTCSR